MTVKESCTQKGLKREPTKQIIEFALITFQLALAAFFI
jgi:hypothetical protein